MNTLKDYVNFKLTHADKTAEAEGYPLVLENCKKNKRMKQLEVYGNSVQDGTPTPEEPIEVQSVGELVTDTNDVNYGKYKVPIVTRGNNLIDSDLWLNYFDKLEDGSYHSKGIITQTTKVPLSLKANTYTISLDIKCPTGTNYRLYMFDANNNELYVWNIKSGTGKWKNIKHTFTTNVDVSYVGWIYSAISDDVSFRNLQVVKGAENLTYEPYIEPTTTNVFLNEPLRKIGDYADCADAKNKKVIQHIKHEKITRVGFKSSSGLVFLSDISQKPFLTGQSNNPIGYATSNKFGQHRGSYSMLKTNGESVPLIQSYITTENANRVAYTFANPSITTVDLAQESIGDGFDVYYVLDTPTEYAIECEFPKLKAKTTIIEVDTTVLSSNMYGKYIKK